jgi:hypothetical protein
MIKIIGYSSDDVDGDISCNKKSIYMRSKIKNNKCEIFGVKKCCYCGCHLTKVNKTREHVIPKHAGGKIIAPCCDNCNTQKGGHTLFEYIEILKELRAYTLKVDAKKLITIKIQRAKEIQMHVDRYLLDPLNK